MRSSIYAIVVAASLLAVSIPSRKVFVSAQNVAGKMSVKIAPDGHGGGNKSSLSSRRRRRPFWKRRTIDAEDASCDGESSPAWETTRRFIERLKMERGMGTLILSTLSLLVVYVSSWKNRRKSNESIGTMVQAEELVCDTPEKLYSGSLQSIEIGFEDISMTLKQKKKDDRVILDSVRGIAKPGRMLAVMGPSGSGKSTFLHSLAGRVKQDKKISLSGRRYINGTPVTGDTQIPAAFIEQDVNFFPHLTVKETLDFRVELQMASVLSKLERDDLVAKLMSDLGLTKSANTIVGNTKVRGLSGGERKRLSIACEMIGGNSVLMLDEPTSGLDSYQAAQVLGTLRKLADQGKTVIAVIHQPSQHTFQLFDDLLLLSEGKMMYYGEVSNVRNYMAEIGYEAEAEVGTAEHILNCISSIVGGDADAEKASVARIEKIAAAADAQSRELVALEDGEQSDRKTKRIVGGTRSHPGANIMRQFSLLLRRSLKEIFRGKAAIIIKVMQQVSLGLIYGGIYTLGLDQSSIMDRFGLLSLIMIGGTNMAVAGTIRAFPKEKAIVSGEMDIKLYRTFPYFIAKAVSELPLIGVFNAIFSSIIYPLTKLQPGRFKRFLAITTGHGIASEAFGLLIGSISPNSDVALALMPPIIVLNIIFDGKNISEENTPWILKWVNKVGLIRWGFTGLALNEFEGLEFTAGGRRGPLTKTGEEALSRFGLDGQSIQNVFTAQTKIVAGCWLLSYLGLSLTKQKFEVMAAPSKREKE